MQIQVDLDPEHALYDQVDSEAWMSWCTTQIDLTPNIFLPDYPFKGKKKILKIYTTDLSVSAITKTDSNLFSDFSISAVKISCYCLFNLLPQH
jgi:hypothetical protein